MAWVYAIECVPTGELYIGSTNTTPNARFGQHRHALKSRKTCASPLLQAAYDKHGMGALRFIPLKEFPEAEVREREAEAIRKVQPALNMVKYATRTRSLKQLKRIARETGLPPSTVRARDAYGWTDEEMGCAPHANKIKYLVDGEELSAPDLAAKYGVKEMTIRNRAHSGFTGDALVASRYGNRGRRRKKYLIGDEMLTVPEIMAKLSMPEHTVWSRLSRGFRGQEFLTCARAPRPDKVIYPPVPRMKYTRLV